MARSGTQRSLRGHSEVTQWHSEALIRGHSVALRGTQRHSVALSGTQWHSAALSGTQWQSMALTCAEAPTQRADTTARNESSMVATSFSMGSCSAAMLCA